MFAQYTDNKGIGLGGLFDSPKVNLDSYEKFINEFKNIESFDEFLDFETNNINWDNLSKSIDITDTRLRSYLETLDDGNGTINNQAASMEGLSKHLEKTGNGFASAAVKTTLLNSALNAGERTAELFDEFQQRNLP